MVFESKCNEQQIIAFKPLHNKAKQWRRWSKQHMRWIRWSRPRSVGWKKTCTKWSWDQGDQGEHEQQYGKEVLGIDLFNIHTLVHGSSPCCSNLNLNITQCYYVNMFHSLRMTNDRAKENLVIILNSLSKKQMPKKNHLWT
jgi:hypothetical protein